MSARDLHLVALLDELAVNATGATTVHLVDGWLLRTAPEFPFRRMNSVFPNHGTGVVDHARLAVVADFYRARDRPVRYQVSPAAHPADLDDRLAAAGYDIEAPVDILVASSTDVLTRLAPAGSAGGAWPVSVAAGIDDAWARAYGELHADDTVAATRIEAYGRLLRTIGPTVIVATVDADDGTPAGVGFGVVARGWLGVYGMATRSDVRRRGVATAVLHALARAANDRGASRCYLQVEVDNAAAQAAYARAGFTRAYGYHYRVKP